MQFHVDMRARELISRGVAPDAAQRLARERFADLDHVAQLCQQLVLQREHAVQRRRYLASLIQDVHFALRMLRRRPAFALIAVATIGLGIGAATAMYSVVDAVMLRPLPFPEAGKLVAIWAVDAGIRKDPILSAFWDRGVIGNGDYQVLQHARTLRDVALWTDGNALLADGASLSRVSTLSVTTTIFPLLGIRASLGRVFIPGDDVLNGPHVAMISWESWQAKFGGDSTVVGRGITLGEQRYSIVGVLPRGVVINRASPPPPIWIPALQDSSDIPANQNRSYRAVARLAPGATIAQANAESARLLHDAANHPSAGSGARVEEWQVDQTRDVRGSLLMLLAAVGLLMLTACVNVAMLLLGEAARRQPEISARAALGAAPARLARQLLTESLAISALGGVLGWAFAWGGTRLLVAVAPPRIPGLADTRLDWRVFAFASACAIITGMAFGWAPAFALLRRNQGASVRIGTGQTPRGATAIQRGLIAAEVALSLVLLVGCALLGKSLARLTRVDPGFEPHGILVVRLAGQHAFTSDNDRVSAFFGEVEREVAALPGVTAVTGASSLPFSGGGSSSPTRHDGKVYRADERGDQTQQHEVLPGFFTVMRIPLLAGRLFADGDRAGSDPVVIVSEGVARRDWPGQTAIGHRLYWQGQWRTVVGIVGEVKLLKLSRGVEPSLYVPFSQRPTSGIGLVIRTSGSVTGLADAIRTRITAVESAVTVMSIDPMASLIERSYGEERYRALLSTTFGVLASVLAGVGMFGVISRSVARRTREAGIRIALGAPSFALTRMMMRETLTGAGIGILVGVPAAGIAARLLVPYLFGVAPTDPAAFLVALVLLAAATLLATIPPALQAGRVDPVTVLRAD
jgi:predicted permease